jgi:hypothetical protein
MCVGQLPARLEGGCWALVWVFSSLERDGEPVPLDNSSLRRWMRVRARAARRPHEDHVQLARSPLGRTIDIVICVA